jgi:hypothetical protein
MAARVGEATADGDVAGLTYGRAVLPNGAFAL